MRQSEFGWFFRSFQSVSYHPFSRLEGSREPPAEDDGQLPRRWAIIRYEERTFRRFSVFFVSMKPSFQRVVEEIERPSFSVQFQIL
jgi:hypothetical protein